MLLWLPLLSVCCRVAAVGVLHIVDDKRVGGCRMRLAVVEEQHSLRSMDGRGDGQCSDAMDGRVAIPVGDRVAQLSDIHVGSTGKID